MKAQTEAKAEATMIISQAEQEAQEIKMRAERAAQKETEDILAVANRKTEITEVEARQKALLFLLRAREDIEKEIGDEYKMVHSRLFSSLQNLMSEAQNIESELQSKRVQLWESKASELKQYEARLLSTYKEAAASSETSAPTEIEVALGAASQEGKVEKPIQLREEALGEKVEEPVQLQEEALEEKVEEPIQLREEALEEKVEEAVRLQEEVIVSKPVEEARVLEQPLPEEKPGREEEETPPLELDSQAPYAGEVEVEIATPTDPKMVYKLYDQLQTIPELRILHTRGSWDEGTVIAVVLEKPMPLVSLLSEIAGVEVTQALSPKDSGVGEMPSSLLGTKRKGTKRIKLTLKSQPASQQ